MTFASDIEAEAEGPILGVVIGEMGWADYNEEGKEIAPDLKGRVLTWEVARPLLDYAYDDGYGAPDCHAITAWTINRAIFVIQYDGSTRLHHIPRAMVDHTPEMPGG